MDSAFEKRKKSHFTLSLSSDSQARSPTGFDKIQLIHSALPDLDIEDVSLQKKWRGHLLQTPFFVSSMTGGWSDSLEFNLKLAQACERRSWIMAVGSQRAQLENPGKAGRMETNQESLPSTCSAWEFRAFSAFKKLFKTGAVLGGQFAGSGDDHSFESFAGGFAKRRHSSI